MPRHDHEASNSSWPARSLTVAEAEQLARLDIFALPGMRLPKGWKISLGGVPVAPVPPVSTPTFLRAVHMFREQLTPEVRELPEYAVTSPLWHNILIERRHELLNRYADHVPPYQHNRQARREFWHGRSVGDMLGAHGTHQGGHGIHPAAHQGAHGAHGAQLGALQDAWLGHASPGGVCVKAEPSSPSRGGRLPVPKPEPSSPGLRAPQAAKQEQYLPPLLAEYANLQAEDGDPEDEPGFLHALRESEAYKPPASLPSRHPDDPEDEPGFTIAMRNSAADVADDESWLYNSDAATADDYADDDADDDDVE